MKRGEKIVNAWKRVKIKTETTPIFKFPPLFSWLAPPPLPPVGDFRELRKRSLFSGNLWTKPIADCKTWQIHVILFLAVDFQREVPKNTFYIRTKGGLTKDKTFYWIIFWNPSLQLWMSTKAWKTNKSRFYVAISFDSSWKHQLSTFPRTFPRGYILLKAWN